MLNNNPKELRTTGGTHTPRHVRTLLHDDELTVTSIHHAVESFNHFRI